MRRRQLLTLAVIGIFLLAPAAISMAGEVHWGSASGGTYEAGAAGESHPSMLGGSAETSREPGTFESREPVEAGQLPSSEGRMISAAGFRPGGESPVVESGGLRFRLEIDAGS